MNLLHLSKNKFVFGTVNFIVIVAFFIWGIPWLVQEVTVGGSDAMGNGMEKGFAFLYLIGISGIVCTISSMVLSWKLYHTLVPAFLALVISFTVIGFFYNYIR